MCRAAAGSIVVIAGPPAAGGGREVNSFHGGVERWNDVGCKGKRCLVDIFCFIDVNCFGLREESYFFDVNFSFAGLTPRALIGVDLALCFEV